MSINATFCSVSNFKILSIFLSLLLTSIFLEDRLGKRHCFHLSWLGTYKATSISGFYARCKLPIYIQSNNWKVLKLYEHDYGFLL